MITPREGIETNTRQSLLGTFMTLRGVPRRVLGATVAALTAGAVVGLWFEWPLWAQVSIGMAISAPVFFIETSWMRRHFEWIALFYALVVVQGGHFGEHVAQMVQIHLLGRSGPAARGIIGQLDVEWVHLGFNTFVLAAIVALLVRFRDNPWLWVSTAFAVWHQVEHTYIISVFVSTGEAGTPGLLAEGGRIGGGIGLTRPDLHFLYNLAETVPLFIAFGWQLSRSTVGWLSRALPDLPPDALVEVSDVAHRRRLPAGTVLAAHGGPARNLFVLAQGAATVHAHDPDGEPSDRLGPGDLVGHEALRAGGVHRTTTVAATALDVIQIAGPPLQEILVGAGVSTFALEHELDRRGLDRLDPDLDLHTNHRSTPRGALQS